ncbi:hypothetical protein ABZ896_21205 [Streptomyces sp. NPDC047072]|uniref:hypothetical protein n=1 Tax=Streptomyces sp. NPDC047072 TaxID=3154809 RepID=UPI0033EDCB85
MGQKVLEPGGPDGEERQQQDTADDQTSVTATPMGTLIRKTPRQLRPLEISPPATGPIAEPPMPCSTRDRISISGDCAAPRRTAARRR